MLYREIRCWSLSEVKMLTGISSSHDLKQTIKGLYLKRVMRVKDGFKRVLLKDL